MPNDAAALTRHLALYGIAPCASAAQWQARWHAVDPALRAALDATRQPGATRAPTTAEQLRFYGAMAAPQVAGVMYSRQANTLHAIGSAVAALVAGRQLLLDLGCNIGHLTSWYAASGAVRSVTGMDFVPQCIASARALAQAAGAAASFVDGDITQALPAGTFDAITDTHTLSTLPNAAPTLALLRSALQRDGIFVSVLAHGTAASTAEFADALATAGLHVHTLQFVYGTDLGQTAAHPLLLAAIAQPGTRVDIAGGFAAARLPGA